MSWPGASPAAAASVGDDLLSDGKERPFAQAPHDARSADVAHGVSNELLDRWVERAHAGIDRLADAAGPRLQRWQDGMSATRTNWRRRAEHVREDGEEWAESLRSTVREHPVASIAVAAVFGMLIARVSRR